MPLKFQFSSFYIVSFVIRTEGIKIAKLLTVYTRAGKSAATLLYKIILSLASPLSPQKYMESCIWKIGFTQQDIAFILQPDITLNLQHDWRSNLKEVKWFHKLLPMSLNEETVKYGPLIRQI